MPTIRIQVGWWRAVDWRTVAVAGLPMWGLVVGVVVWAKLSPQPLPAQSVARAEPLLPPVPPEPQVITDREVLPPPRPVEEPVKQIDPAVVNAIGNGGKVVLQAIFAGKGEEDHPLVEPPPVEVAEKKPIKIPDGCKTYDTAIHFVKNLETAQKRAKADGRLVFVLHLSGNIEDPGFT